VICLTDYFSKNEAESIINAINATFALMHDDNMDANFEWSVRNNCSDVVLKL